MLLKIFNKFYQDFRIVEGNHPKLKIVRKYAEFFALNNI